MKNLSKDMPPRMRERMMSLPPVERQRLMARRRARLESMDKGSRDAMRRYITYMRQRPDPPEVGTEAPDFHLAVLDAGGARLRLRDQRGKPVGLIFGSYT